MMKRILLGGLCVITFASCDPAALQQAMDSVLTTSPSNSLTTKNVADGLKQALEIGITDGANKLSITDGYYKSAYKILLPEEAQKVADKLRNVPGFNSLEENILEKVNRGAEDAAKKAAPIFKQAILSMTFADAWDILMGDKDAATKYLKKVTYQQLYSEFNPVIVESLDKFNARTYWSSAVDKYNKIPFVEKANPDLDDHVTSEALAGLFEMVRLKELDIRENTASRTTDLLKRVFAKQDK
jgi:hypothetical protein